MSLVLGCLSVVPSGKTGICFFFLSMLDRRSAFGTGHKRCSYGPFRRGTQHYVIFLMALQLLSPVRGRACLFVVWFSLPQPRIPYYQRPGRGTGETWKMRYRARTRLSLAFYGHGSGRGPANTNLGLFLTGDPWGLLGEAITAIRTKVSDSPLWGVGSVLLPVG